MEAPKEAPKVEAKPEEKKPEEAKAVKKYNPPQFGDSKYEGIIPGVKGINEQIAILSYLPYKWLIHVAKSSRFAYNMIMHRPTRKKILSWKPDKDDETKLSNYINNAINKIAATKTA